MKNRVIKNNRSEYNLSNSAKLITTAWTKNSILPKIEGIPSATLRSGHRFFFYFFKWNEWCGSPKREVRTALYCALCSYVSPPEVSLWCSTYQVHKTSSPFHKQYNKHKTMITTTELRTAHFWINTFTPPIGSTPQKSPVNQHIATDGTHEDNIHERRTRHEQLAQGEKHTTDKQDK
jgi:hypothetical protein